MKLVSLILFLTWTFAGAVASGQELKSTSQEALKQQQLVSERATLLSDLQNLDYQALNLSDLARASVKAELADAAWDIDRTWSKELLTKAYSLTLPSEDEQSKLRSRAVGSQPVPPAQSDRARRAIRNRIVQIAAKEKSFVDQLVQSGVNQIGRSEGQMTYATLADNARLENDLEAAGKYLLQSVEMDPSQIAAGYLIADIARTDRSKADELILQYFRSIITFPLSSANNSLSRIYLVVHKLLFPPADVKPPGPDVMRAYVNYVIQSLGSMEQREPGSLRVNRPFLLRAYFSLKQYAPDLTSDFLLLEQKSRTPDKVASVDADATEFLNRIEQNRSKDISENESPTERQIFQCISNHDFTKARKLIDRLAESADRERLGDLVNVKEAIYLLNKDKILEARGIAEKVRHASAIEEVYVALILKCVSVQNNSVAQDVMVQAMRQLKTSNSTLANLPMGIPASFAATSRDVDPILNGMAKLTLAVSSSSLDVAMIGLSETIGAANVSEIDTTQGRAGFDISIFKRLAPKDEMHVRLAAESFKDPLRRLLALAAIDQWKAADVAERQKKLSKSSDSLRSKLRNNY
jgi:hypothetical protein